MSKLQKTIKPFYNKQLENWNNKTLITWYEQ